jgi:hypothetical protein
MFDPVCSHKSLPNRHFLIGLPLVGIEAAEVSMRRMQQISVLALHLDGGLAAALVKGNFA